MPYQHPAHDLSGIYTGTGLNAYLKGGQKASLEVYSSYHSAANDLNNAIRKLGGGKAVLFGVDTRIVARRISRPIFHAAEAHLTAALMLQRAWSEYDQLIGAAHKPRKGAFDPKK